MKTKRVILGLLALLLLLALRWWRNLPVEIESGQASSVALAPQHSLTVVSAPKPAAASSVEAPKQPPVKASESPPPPPNDNDWGMIEFTDGVPVVRTMATGEMCVIIPTVFTANAENQIELKMIVEKPGSLQMSSADIEALRGPAAKNFINSELTAAKSDSSKVIESMPSIVAMPGEPVRVGVGSARDGNIMSIDLVPLITGSHPGLRAEGDAPTTGNPSDAKSKGSGSQ